MHPPYQHLAPYSDLDPVTLTLLQTAYRTKKQEHRPATGEELRFAANTTQAHLQFACTLNLLTGEGGPDAFRPTAMALLYLEDAVDDVRALKQLVELAHKVYRPGAAPLSGDEVCRATNLSPERLAWLMFWAPDVGVNLFGQPPALQLQAAEHNWRSPTLGAALAQRYVGAFSGGQQHSLYDPQNVSLPPAAFRVQLERLSCRRFRVLRDFDLELGLLTVLVGPNGVGKSTVLDLVAFLAASTSHGPAQTIEAEGGLSHLLTRGASGPLQVGAELRLDYGGNDSPRGRYSFELNDVHGHLVVEAEKLEVAGKEFLTTTRGRARMTTAAGAVEDNYQAPGALAVAELIDDRKYPVAVGLREAWGRVLLVDRDAVASGAGGRVNHPAAAPFGRGQRLRQRFAPTVEEVLGTAMQTEAQTQKLSALVSEVVPSIVEVDREIVPGGLPRLRVLGGDGQFEFAELSAGERQLILLCAIYLLERPPTLLLLEEPDAGLSSGSLPALRDLLRSLAGKMQVLATTHSPLLVGLLDADREVKAVERTEGGIRARALSESLRSLSWLSAFGTAEAFSRSASERRR